MPTIEIRDGDKYLSFDLRETLDVIQPFVAGLHWHFIDLDVGILVGENGTRDQSPPDWVPALLQKVKDTSGATEVDWQTLNSLARYIGQTESLLLIGSDLSRTSLAEPIDLNSPDHAVVVQAVDTSFWAITSRNQALIEAVRHRFKQTRIVEGTARYF